MFSISEGGEFYLIKMTKIITLGVLLLSLYSCQYKNQLYSDKKLTEKIEREVSFETSNTDFANINYFEWDSLLILNPYSNIEVSGKKLNLNLGNIRNNEIEFSDSFNLIIFIKNEKAVKISELSREFGDFSNPKEVIGKKQAKYIKSKQGKNVLMKSNINITGIPMNAFWAGRGKTGNWFNVEHINRDENMVTISIYDDVTGSLILHETFMKICHADNLHFIENLKEEIDYFDGEKILLNDSCFLLQK